MNSRKRQDYLKARFPNNHLGSSMRLLRLLDAHGPTPQTQAANKLGMTLASANLHFQRLTQQRLVAPVGKQLSKGRGRPSIVWDIDRDANLTIGVVVFPPMIYMGLATFGGDVKLRHQYDISKMQRSEILRCIDGFMHNTLEYVKVSGGTIRFAHVGMPGEIAPETGKVTDAVNMPELNGLDMEDYFRTEYDIPSIVQSSAYASYFGEIAHLPKGTTVAVLCWGLGLGSLFGCDEEIFNYMNRAGRIYRKLWDFGHIRISKGGKMCHCGQPGCLEAYVGGWAMLRDLADKASELSEVIALAKDDDPAALDVCRHAGRTLGESLTMMIEVLGIERIIVTGPLSEIFPKMKDAFCDGLASRLLDEEIRELAPQASEDPIGRMIAGACHVARFSFFYPLKLVEERKIPSHLHYTRPEFRFFNRSH